MHIISRPPFYIALADVTDDICDMESKARAFKIKYVDGDPDSIVHVERSKSVQQLLSEVRIVWMRVD